MSFVERFIVLCPYLGESTIRGPTVYIYIYINLGISSSLKNPSVFRSLFSVPYL